MKRKTVRQPHSFRTPVDTRSYQITYCGADASEGEEQVEFDFGDPSEPDFHIIKSLLQRFLDADELDSSALADMIIDEV